MFRLWYLLKWLRHRHRKPHEIWPEVLHWREGDGFMLAPFDWVYLYQVQADGNVIVDTCSTPGFTRLDRYRIWRLIGRNRSLSRRQEDAILEAKNSEIQSSMQNSAEYMELLKAFNRSVEELREKDRRDWPSVVEQL